MVLLVFLRGLKRLELSKVGSLRRLSLLPPRSLRSLRSRSGEVEGGDAKDRRGLMERLEVVTKPMSISGNDNLEERVRGTIT